MAARRRRSSSKVSTTRRARSMTPLRPSPARITSGATPLISPTHLSGCATFGARLTTAATRASTVPTDSCVNSAPTASAPTHGGNGCRWSRLTIRNGERSIGASRRACASAQLALPQASHNGRRTTAAISFSTYAGITESTRFMSSSASPSIHGLRFKVLIPTPPRRTTSGCISSALRSGWRSAMGIIPPCLDLRLATKPTCHSRSAPTGTLTIGST